MKSILQILLPGIAIYLIYTNLGLRWGILAFLIYVLLAFIVKRPDLLMVKGAKRYKEDPQEGLAIMEKALRTKRLKTDYVLYYSFMCLKAGEYDRAEEILDIAAHRKMSPDQSCRATVNRSLLFWKKGELEKAISILEEQMKLGKDRSVYGTLGQLLILSGRLQRAMELNREAYTFDKYDEAIVDNLALNYRLAGDLDSSWNLYKELTGKRLGVPIPYYNAGETLYALGRKEEARDMMQNALGYSFSSLAVISKEEIEERMAQISAEIEENEKN